MKHDELKHYGVLGMKWGVRKYQNKDGSLTSAGRKRYGKGELMSTTDKADSAVTRRVKKDYNTMSDKDFSKKYQVSKERYRKRVNKYGDPYMKTPQAKLAKAYAKHRERKAVYDATYLANGYQMEAMLRSIIPGSSDKVRELQEKRLNAIASSDFCEKGRKRTEKVMNQVGKKYKVVYDVGQGTYLLEKKNKKAPHKLSLADIDDPDLIELNIDDPEFRSEYNVTDEQYKRYKKKYG